MATQSRDCLDAFDYRSERRKPEEQRPHRRARIGGRNQPCERGKGKHVQDFIVYLAYNGWLRQASHDKGKDERRPEQKLEEALKHELQTSLEL